MAVRREYRREFFDRDYGAAAVYARLWRMMKGLRLRLAAGVVCGLIGAGALVPFYQMIQPTVAEVPITQAAADSRRGDAKDRALEKAARLPAWFARVEQLAGKAGLDLSRADGSMSPELLLIVFAVLPAVCGLRLLMTFLGQYCIAWTVTKTAARLRMDMLAHVERQSLEFQARVDVGQLMTRLTADPAQISRLLSLIVPEISRAPFEIAVSVGFICAFACANGMLGMLGILAVAVPLFVLPVAALGRRMRKWTKRSLERGSVVGADIHEVLTCVRTVKAYHTEERENAVFRRVYDHLNKSILRSLRIGLLTGPLVESVGLVLVGAALVGCFSAGLPVEKILPLLAPALMAYAPIKEISKLQVQVQDSLAALSRVFSLLDCRFELEEKPDAVRKSGFEDAIRFDHVSFVYGGSRRPAVDDVCIEIRRGEKVAVVGSTGSGKSTLGALLTRFYDPTGGAITIDGVDLRDLAIGDVHRLTGVVLQETFLFNDTIEANIRYGLDGVTREQIVAAAKAANAYDFIMARPEGFRSLCGEKGFALSGGERQRIAIARAILLDPPILILDEATSALDTVTEHLVQSALDRLKANRTVLAIAHRLSTVRDADQILVMEDGRIVERGTHAELTRRQGVYRRLCAAQTRTEAGQ